MRVSVDEILETMKSDLNDEYSIGIHTIKINCNSFLKSKYKIIKTRKRRLKNGISPRLGDVFYTVNCLGLLSSIINNESFKKENFQAYNYWREKDVNNIIVAVPTKIIIDGVEYSVGILENESYLVSKGIESDNKVLIRELVDYKVPSEFIYGYYSRKATKNEDLEIQDNSIDIPRGVSLDEINKNGFVFRKNPNHISNKSSEEQSKFYKELLKENGVPLGYIKKMQYFK